MSVKTTSDQKIITEKEYAEWVSVECPKCEHGGMVAKDKFGLFCVVTGCGWKKDIVDLENGV